MNQEMIQEQDALGPVKVFGLRHASLYDSNRFPFRFSLVIIHTPNVRQLVSSL